MHFADRLVQRINETNSRLVVGLDPHWDLIPSEFKKDFDGKCSRVLHRYFINVIDATRDFAVAYKPQIAFFEQYGIDGLSALCDLIRYIQSCGSLVLMDAKRNDIGSTAAAYARAFFGDDRTTAPFPSDAITLNAYLGSDGVQPFMRRDKGIFVLAKTSNPSSHEIQDKVTQRGTMVCQEMADLICGWNRDSIGNSGYGNVGAVVGATYPEHMQLLRRQLPHSFLLVPGFGVQKGSDTALKAAFNRDGLGALIAASRAISFPQNVAENGFDAVAKAAHQAKDHINAVIADGL